MRSAVTHAITMNGRIHGELKDPDNPADETIKKRLALLDGTTRYSLSLWRLPDDVPFDKVDLSRWPQEYLQVAGSRTRMTVEVRRIEDGIPRQYVVGHAPVHASSRPGEIVPWNGYEARVHPTEVFDVAEVGEIFAAYYATGSIPDGYAMRALVL